MVGFPGETESDHRATAALVASLPFTYLHVFPYSARPGTAAGRLGKAGDPVSVAARGAELRELAQRKGRTHASGRDREEADVVVTGRLQGKYEGLTEDYLTVQISSDAPLDPRFDATLHVSGDRLAAVVGSRQSVVGRDRFRLLTTDAPLPQFDA
jgi:threonylcarbamoyladenosine tRNA methylthiotransferase MtaB